MRHILLELLPDQSDVAFATLVSNGIPASFVRRGVDCDVVSVPSKYASVTRRLLAYL